MPSLADLTVDIKADLSELKRGLDTAETQAKTSGNKMGGALKAGIGIGAAAAAGAIVGIGVAAFKASEEVNTAYGKIQAGTGATGKALDGLKSSFDAVFGETTANAEQVSGAIADLNTRFGITGKELEDLSLKAIKFTEATGEDGVAAMDSMGRAMNIFNKESHEAAGLFDQLLAASQASGASMTDLSGNLQTYGAVLANAGFTMEESVAIFAEMHAKGTDVSRLMPGLNKAFRDAAEEGKNGKDVYNDLVRELSNTEDETKALTRATEVLGAEGAQRFLNFAKQGDEAGTTIQEAMNNAQGATETMYEASLTAGDKIEILKTKATELAAEFGNKMIPIIEEFIPILRDTFMPLWEGIVEIWKDELQPALTVLVNQFRDDFLPALKDTYNAVEPVLIPALKILAGLFTGLLKSGLDTITGALKVVAGVLTGDFSKAWEGAKQMATGVMNAIITAYNNTIGKLPGVSKIDMVNFKSSMEVAETAITEAKKTMEAEAPKMEAAVKTVATTADEVATDYKKAMTGPGDDSVLGATKALASELESEDGPLAKLRKAWKKNAAETLGIAKKMHSDLSNEYISWMNTGSQELTDYEKALARVKGAYESHGEEMKELTEEELQKITDEYRETWGSEDIDGEIPGIVSTGLVGVNTITSTKFEDIKKTTGLALSQCEALFRASGEAITVEWGAMLDALDGKIFAYVTHWNQTMGNYGMTPGDNPLQRFSDNANLDKYKGKPHYALSYDEYGRYVGPGGTHDVFGRDETGGRSGVDTLFDIYNPNWNYDDQMSNLPLLPGMVKPGSDAHRKMVEDAGGTWDPKVWDIAGTAPGNTAGNYLKSIGFDPAKYGSVQKALRAWWMTLPPAQRGTFGQGGGQPTYNTEPKNQKEEGIMSFQEQLRAMKTAFRSGNGLAEQWGANRALRDQDWILKGGGTYDKRELRSWLIDKIANDDSLYNMVAPALAASTPFAQAALAEIDSLRETGMFSGGIAFNRMPATIGEFGPEAVIPLDQFPSLMAKTFRYAFGGMGGGMGMLAGAGGSSRVINVIVPEGAYVMDDFVEAVKDALDEADRRGNI